MAERKPTLDTKGPALIAVYPPNEVYFSYIPKRTLPSTISLVNLQGGKVAFKIRTNQPNSYVVKPSEGVLEAKGSISIEIIMQPTDYNPTTNIISDKFQIVACQIDDSMNMAKITEALKNTSNPAVQMTKLKVVLRTESMSSSMPPTTSVQERPIYNLQASLPIIDVPPKTTFETMPAPKEISPTMPLNNAQLTGSRDNTSYLSNSLQGSVYGNVNNSEQKQLYSSILGSPGVTTNELKIPINYPKLTESARDEPMVSYDNVIGRSSAGLQSGVGLFNSDNNEEFRRLLDKSKNDDRIIYELKDENRKLQKDNDNLKETSKKHEDMLFTLSQQRNIMKAELDNLKNSTMKMNQGNKTHSGESTQSYQLWQIILVAIVALILGAFLSSN
jgi:hypothetical protein